jgi:LmbE family N-acetylglucosaminyl deacetylase
VPQEISLNSKVALCVGAHPDDVVLGMGGLASRLTLSGWTVHLLTLSRGELCGDPDTREQEERAASAVIGALPRFGMLPDAEISLRAAIEVVESTIEDTDPCLLFAPVSSDSHQDHCITSAAVQSICRKRRDVLFYEGPSTREFHSSMVVDISPVWEIKERALRCHFSQVGPKNLLRWAQAASAYRAWPRYPGGKCEAFQADQLDCEIVFGFSNARVTGRIGEAVRVAL